MTSGGIVPLYSSPGRCLFRSVSLGRGPRPVGGTGFVLKGDASPDQRCRPSYGLMNSGWLVASSASGHLSRTCLAAAKGETFS